MNDALAVNQRRKKFTTKITKDTKAAQRSWWPLVSFVGLSFLMPAHAGDQFLSMRDLLARPADYVGKTISVRGHVAVAGEDTNIYLSREHSGRECVSLAMSWKDFQAYRKFNGQVANVSGIVVSPACPEKSICTWYCNHQYGIEVSSID